MLGVLSNAITSGNTVKLGSQLPPPLYKRTNKVLEAAGGTWRRSAQAHVFQGDAAEALEQIILTGEITTTQDFGMFFSPAPVADRVIKLAQLRPGQDFLEPNAGRGALASRALLAGCNVDCIELLEANVKILCSTPYRTVVQGDFLANEPTRTYSRIAMNPPFAGQADIKHVQHALRFLEPDGLLVSVMSAGIQYRTNRLTDEFRELLDARGATIEACADGAFRESGTMVRTVIVTIPGEEF